MAISMMGQPPGGPMMGGGANVGGQQLDTAETANKPQADDQDGATFTAMVAGLRAHIFGKGEQGIVEQLSQAQGEELGRVMGEITFALVQEAAHQAEQSGRELSMDILMGVATEVIDDLTDLIDAHGIEVTDKDREYALLYAQQLYQQTLNPSDEEQAAAKQQLAQFKQGGELDTATKYVQQRGMEAGVDPFDVAHMTPEGEGKPGMMGKQPKG